MNRLNIGSGQRPFDKPWINIDVNPQWKPDILADGSSLPMFEDGTAEIIVLHHVLEHFGCGEADALIKECHRLLCREGSLIICVPDMREIAKAWLRGDMDDQIYMTSVYGAYMGNEADRHKWGYWVPSLKGMMHRLAHWQDIRPFDWRPIEGASIAKDWWVLAMECIR